MTDYATILLSRYPVRRSREEKERFRRYVIAEAERLGYPVTVEHDGDVSNVVVGRAAEATWLLSAHYDTCPNRFFPGLIAPGNPLLTALWQVLFPVLLVALMCVLAFGVGFVLQLPKLVFPLWLLLLAGCILFFRFGPSNRSNSNDNTSGVAALLELMAALEPQERRHAAFVFFDGNYQNAKGARKYRRRHDESYGQIVFGFDCVGEGEYLLFCPSKYSRWDGDTLNALVEAAPEDSSRRIVIKDQGFCFFPSDQRKFKFSIGVGAFHKTAAVGYWVGGLNTAGDTKLDGENLRILTGLMKRFLAAEGKPVKQPGTAAKEADGD